jgi:hypothetical protein
MSSIQMSTTLSEDTSSQEQDFCSHLQRLYKKKSVAGFAGFTILIFFFYASILLELYIPGLLNIGDENNFLNRFAVISVVLLSAPYLSKIIRYYYRTFGWHDVLLIFYIMFFFVGVDKSRGFLAFTPLLRLLVCFYLVSFLLRRPRTLVRYTYLLVMFVAIFEIGTILRFPGLLTGSGRLDFPRYLGVTGAARLMLTLSLLCYWIFIADNLYSRLLRVVALVETVIAIALALATGSRQMVLGMGIIIVGLLLLRERVIPKFSQKGLLLVSSSSLALAVVMAWILLGQPGSSFLADNAALNRAFTFTPTQFDESVGRLATWDLYINHLGTNYSSMIFQGFRDDPKNVFGGQSEVYGAQIQVVPHNSVLAMIVQSGLVSAVLYILWHISLMFALLRGHYLLGGMYKSSIAVSGAIAAFVIGLLSNYFTIVASPLAYLFYVVAGIYVNLLRDKKLYLLAR